MNSPSVTCPSLECCDPNPFSYAIPDVPELEMGDICSTCNGQTFSQTITAEGIGPTLTWTISSGAVPSGLTFHGGTNSNGYVLIDGSPTGAGPSTFTVNAADNHGNSISATFTIRVVDILTTSLPNFNVGFPYFAQLTATGGFGPYTWFILSGNLPSGITLNPSNGVISGTPNGSNLGSGNITFGVIDIGCASGQVQGSQFQFGDPLTNRQFGSGNHGFIFGQSQ